MRRGFDHLLPSTFEERGASVPFTTPALSDARVRKDFRDRLEIVVGQFSGGPGAYVIPWAALPNIVSLTTHDILLHERVNVRQALDPYNVRLCALEVAKSGLAGPDVVAGAAKALADDEEAKALNQVVLIIKVIEEAEPLRARELMRNITTPEGQERVRVVFFAIGDRLRLDPKAFDQRLSDLGIATYPVGTTWSPVDGRLRRLLRRLEMFSSALASWSSERLGESADQATFTVEVVEHTLKLAREALQRFNAVVGSPRQIVADWEARAPAVRRLVMRMAWLLDGWQPLIEMWAGAVGDDAQVEALAFIVPRLPFIPAKELEPDTQARATSLLGRASKWVRMNEDWKTGEPDMVMVRRLEELKARGI
jgi:hypothetical protein